MAEMQDKPLTPGHLPDDVDLCADAYDYHLPEELIADAPCPNRAESRLMAVPAKPGAPPVHARFQDLRQFLRPGDLLVVNDSRVIPARLFGRREPGGGQCEVLLLSPAAPAENGQPRWKAMVRPGKRIRPGCRIAFAEDFAGEVEDDLGGGERLIRFECHESLHDALDRHGNMPLPPYILARRGERLSREEDRTRYQTVYARHDGSVAAPTAGLHFTEGLLDALARDGIEHVRVTLHVGAGTFQPITADRVTDHAMHSEYYEIAPATALAITRAKSEGRRVVAVGTTSVRTLETAATAPGVLEPGAGESTLLIVPGYKFKLIDGLITNFHLPRSTLLCLVSALTGRPRLLDLYAQAIAERYRFYSYGDAMLVWRTR